MLLDFSLTLLYTGNRASMMEFCNTMMIISPPTILDRDTHLINQISYTTPLPLQTPPKLYLHNTQA